MPIESIYPSWSIFVKPIPEPLNDRERYMTKRQEAVGEDIERFFGCLQGGFKIFRQERGEWSDENLEQITNTCVLLHHMIVKPSLEGHFRDEITTDGASASP